MRRASDMREQDVKDRTALLVAAFMTAATFGSGYVTHAATGSLKAAFGAAAAGLIAVLGSAACGFLAGAADERIKAQQRGMASAADAAGAAEKRSPR